MSTRLTTLRIESPCAFGRVLRAMVYQFNNVYFIPAGLRIYLYILPDFPATKVHWSPCSLYLYTTTSLLCLAGTPVATGSSRTLCAATCWRPRLRLSGCVEPCRKDQPRRAERHLSTQHSKLRMLRSRCPELVSVNSTFLNQNRPTTYEIV